MALSSSVPVPQEHNLPVLFQFSHPTHNVAVFRGADLKKAIAAGVVKGFGNLGDSDNSAAAAGDEARDGRSDDSGDGDDNSGSYAPPTTAAPPPPPTYATTTTPPPPPPPTTPAYVAPETVAPAYTPAPVVYK